MFYCRKSATNLPVSATYTGELRGILPFTIDVIEESSPIAPVLSREVGFFSTILLVYLGWPFPKVDCNINQVTLETHWEKNDKNQNGKCLFLLLLHDWKRYWKAASPRRYCFEITWHEKPSNRSAHQPVRHTWEGYKWHLSEKVLQLNYLARNTEAYWTQNIIPP